VPMAIGGLTTQDIYPLLCEQIIRNLTADREIKMLN
jgi:hypothetical protein